MAEVELKGLEKLQKMEDIFYKELQEATRQLMADVMLRVVLNTNAGKNAYNVPFTPYAKFTIKKKIKDGKQTSPNMQDSSSMINSLGFLPARNTKYFIVYKIGVKGGYKGVSNKAKLRYLRDHKNYLILAWTPFYIKMVNQHFKRFVARYIRIVN